jgi:predicted  nucleic acid-binding Zn-ribbon protein
MSLEATLAELAVEIRHLRDDITEMKSQTQRDQDKADISRAKVHARLDDVAKSVTVLEEQRKTDTEKLDALGEATSKRLESVEVVTNEVKRWKIMGMTSISIVGIGAAALGITFADFFKRLLQLVVGRL